MRVNEIICESAESIITHMLLLGFNLSELERWSASAISSFNSDKSLLLAVKTVLMTINQQCLAIHSNDDFWSSHVDDPEVELVYDRVATLFNRNTEFLENL